MAKAGNVISGAGQGAAAGSAFGPWGALIGGAAGGLMGAFQDDPNAARNDAINAYNAAAKGATQNYAANQENLLGNYSSLWNLGDIQQAQQKYQDALNNTKASDYSVDASVGQQSAVDPLSTWKQYLDPSIAYQQEAARKNVEESAAGQGGLYSGAAAREIAANTADIASTGATNAMNMARQNALDNNAVAQTNLNNQINAGNYNVGLQDTDINRLFSAYGIGKDAMDTDIAGRSELNKTKLDSTLNAANLQLQSKLGTSQDEDLWGSILGAADAGSKIKSMWGK